MPDSPTGVLSSTAWMDEHIDAWMDEHVLMVGGLTW